MENNGRLHSKIIPTLTVEETHHIEDTLPYVNMHMNEILNEAFINMFTLNPDIQDKFFKDYATEAETKEPKSDKYESK